MELFKLFGTIAINVDEAKKKIDDVAEKASSAAKKIGDKFESFGKSVTSIGTKMSIGLTAPLTLIGKKALRVSSDFEYAMSGVQAISGATSKEFESLRDLAIDLGGSTKFSASEVAYAMTEMAKAGWSTTQIMDGMSGVLDASAASGADLATASTIVADAITGFGLSASESARVADLLTQAANSGTIEVYDLGETFKYISPVAKSLGLSIEDVTTATTAMSMAGIKGSQAGTSLRTVMTNLVKPTDQMSTAIEELGIETVNADGSFKSLDEILAIMRESFKGLTEEQKAYYGAVLAGKEGMSGLLALLSMTQEEYDAIAVSMDNCNGIAYETATIMQDNLKSKVEQLGGSLESLAIKLADLVVPHLIKLVERITNVVDAFANLDPEVQKVILAIAGFIAAIGPVLTVVGKVVASIGNLIKVGGPLISGIGKVASGVTSLFGIGSKLLTGIISMGGKITGMLIPALASIGPVGWAIIAAIGALIAIGVALYKNWDEVCAWASKTWGAIKETIGGIIDSIAGFFTGIIDFVKNNWPSLLSMISNPFVGAFNLIYDNCEGFRNFINNFLNGIKEMFMTAWNGIKESLLVAWNGIKEAISMALENIKNVIMTAWEGIKSAVATALEAIKSVVIGAWEAIKSAISTAMETIRMVISTAWETIKTAIANALEVIKSVIVTAWETIKLAVSTALEAIKFTITAAWEAIKSAISAAMETIKTVITTAWEAIKAAISTALEAIKAAISTAWENIKSVVSNAINAVKETISNGINAAKDIIANVLDSIRDKFTSIFDSAKEIVSNAIETIKGFFNFEWKLPDIKLPHFSIDGEFSLNPPSIPSFGIEWYKDGGIMNNPTLFGFNPFSNKAMVGGEAGPEAIAPISTLKAYIREAVSENNGQMLSVLNAMLSVLNQYLPKLANMQLVMDTGETVGALAPVMSEELGRITHMRGRRN